jgi:hypothetical protein
MANLYDQTDPLTPKKGLIDALMGGATAGNAGIAPGEMSPNSGPIPAVDQPLQGVAGPVPSIGDAPKAAPKITLGSNGYSTTTPGRPFLLGFDAGKLLDPNSGSAEGSKYTKDAKAFGQAYLGGTDIGRGNLGPMVDALKGQGLGQAVAVGDDKIDPDGPGPQSPIDVIGSDGSVRYQNTTDNAQWEAGHGGGGGGAAAGGGGAGGNLNPLLQGDPQAGIQSALGQYGQQSDFLKQLLAKLQGGGQ